MNQSINEKNSMPNSFVPSSTSSLISTVSSVPSSSLDDLSQSFIPSQH